DGQQVDGGAADGLLLGGTEQSARALAPVGHEAVAFDYDPGQRDTSGRDGFRHRAVPSSAAGRYVPLGATVHGPGPLSPRLKQDLCRPHHRTAPGLMMGANAGIGGRYPTDPPGKRPPKRSVTATERAPG